MTTQTVETEADSASSEVSETDNTEIEQRGKLEIDPSVVRKIATFITDSSPGSVGVSRTIGSDRGANIRVGGTGNVIDLDVDLGLEYPIDIRKAIADLRAKLTEEINKLTGYRVRTVEVTVSALRSGSTTSRVQ